MQRDDRAVSSVVGTILLVGIVVVVAAGAYIGFQNLVKERPDRPPEVSLLANTDTQEVKLVRAQWFEGDLVWEDIAMPGCDISGLSGPLEPGTLLVCSGEVTMIHTPTQTVIWSYSFS